MQSKLSVTVISGFVGSGKTSLINQLIKNRIGKRIAVLLNQNPTADQDALQIDSSADVRTVTEKWLEVSNGHVCSVLRKDLLDEVTALANEKRYDYLIIESNGIAEPLPIAETFIYRDENGHGLLDIAELDTLVTVINASTFWDDYQSYEDLTERGVATVEGDHRNVVDLLVDQIEFSNVIVLNHSDQPDVEDIEELLQFLVRVNPFAKIVLAEHGNIPNELVLGAKHFNQDWEQGHPDWLATIESDDEGSDPSAQISSGMGSFMFYAQRPFHPQRLWENLDLQDGLLDCVLRSKGYCWLATHHNEAMKWSQSGVSVRIESDGPWMIVVPREEWPDDVELQRELDEAMIEPWGDRRQELLFIGHEMDEIVLRSRLEACLLTDEEMKAGPDVWAEYPNPMPIPGAEEFE